MRPWTSYLAGVGYATIFGLSFLVTKGALASLDAFDLLFLRFALAAVLMSLLALLGIVKLHVRAKLARTAPGADGAASDPAPRGSAIRALALACLFQPILYFACETLGVRESATSTAGLVIGALPACVAVLGAFMLDERLTARQTASLALSVAGVALIVVFTTSDGGEGSAVGFLCLLGAVAAATLYNIYSRLASRLFTPAETTFAMMWTGALAFGAVSTVRGFLAEGTAWPTLLAARALPAAGGILYLGVLSSVVAFFFVNFTLSRLQASQSAVFANLTTVVAVAAGVLLRGERFGLVQAAGAVLIVLGVWGTNAARRPPAREPRLR